ncbi:MAG: DUF5683 domain-containing protein [Flavobacteriaceae bacterium]|nr:DUF5683 domain-containing protein [Flavobacteriaceae bacterium]
MKKFIFIFAVSFQCFLAQENSADSLKTENKVVAEIESLHRNIKPFELSPKKAGWRSAILPGWGQYYNRKYWKIPIVWGAIGTGVGFIAWNQKQYRRYKIAFEAELKGESHEFSDIKGIDLKTALGLAQDARKRQRDYAIVITAGIYLLNIIDAVVDAHLYEGRKDSDLAISPIVLDDFSSLQEMPKIGLSFNYSF